jgi:hypothetical protein
VHCVAEFFNRFQFEQKSNIFLLVYHPLHISLISSAIQISGKAICHAEIPVINKHIPLTFLDCADSVTTV